MLIWCTGLVYPICRRLHSPLIIEQSAIVGSSIPRRRNEFAGSDCAMSTSNINFAGCTQYLHLITAVCANAISFSLSFSSFSPGHLSFPAPFSVTAALVTSFSFSSRPVRSLCVRLLLLDENLMLPRLHNAKSVRRLRSARESLFCIRDSERFW